MSDSFVAPPESELLTLTWWMNGSPCDVTVYVGDITAIDADSLERDYLVPMMSVAKAQVAQAQEQAHQAAPGDDRP